MIKIIDENVFDSNADCITNTINCIGFMGKGLALEFALRYPELEEQYVSECKKHQIKTGRVYFYNINGQKIINFPTKFHYKDPSKIEWIEQGLNYVLLHYKNWNIKSLALPLLGARNGGLDPDKVVSLIKQKLANIDIPIYICLNKKDDQVSYGLLQKFNNCNPFKLAENLNLNKNQTDSIVKAHKRIKRFVDLSDLPNIGSTSYKKIYRYFLNCDNEEPQQLSLFDL